MKLVRALPSCVLFILITAALFCFPEKAISADTPVPPVLSTAPANAAPATVNSGDNAWLLASSALVLMMTAPGLILFYGGLVRRKNVLATMMHSLFLMGLISFVWMVYGYSLAFGDGNSF